MLPLCQNTLQNTPNCTISLKKLEGRPYPSPLPAMCGAMLQLTFRKKNVFAPIPFSQKLYLHGFTWIN